MNWLINGDLSDPYKEYVIRKAIQKMGTNDECDINLSMNKEVPVFSKL